MSTGASNLVSAWREFVRWGHPSIARNEKIGGETMQTFHRWAELVVA
jgi:hypothetical protein